MTVTIYFDYNNHECICFNIVDIGSIVMEESNVLLLCDRNYT